MGYNDLSECTLTHDERVAEKDRILERLLSIHAPFTSAERDFVLKMKHYNWISVKQLFWLRDINGKY